MTSQKFLHWLKIFFVIVIATIFSYMIVKIVADDTSTSGDTCPADPCKSQRNEYKKWSKTLSQTKSNISFWNKVIENQLNKGDKHLAKEMDAVAKAFEEAVVAYIKNMTAANLKILDKRKMEWKDKKNEVLKVAKSKSLAGNAIDQLSTNHFNRIHEEEFKKNADAALKKCEKG